MIFSFYQWFYKYNQILLGENFNDLLITYIIIDPAKEMTLIKKFKLKIRHTINKMIKNFKLTIIFSIIFTCN